MMVFFENLENTVKATNVLRQGARAENPIQKLSVTRLIKWENSRGSCSAGPQEENHAEPVCWKICRQRRPWVAWTFSGHLCTWGDLSLKLGRLSLYPPNPAPYREFRTYYTAHHPNLIKAESYRTVYPIATFAWGTRQHIIGVHSSCRELSHILCFVALIGWRGRSVFSLSGYA